MSNSTHVTRYSDSSFFDEICVLCGTTDERPGALKGTCHVGASFRHDQHKIVSDSSSKTKIRCEYCSKTEYIDMQGACSGRDNKPAPFPVCEEANPAPVLMEMVETPYGQVAGPVIAIKYVRELIDADTAIHFTQPEHRTFPEELRELINKHSMENRSNTPDWILARMLCEMLDIYRNAVNERDTFHGFNNVGGPVEIVPHPPAPLQPHSPIFPVPMAELVETKDETFTYERKTELPDIPAPAPAGWGDEKRTFMGPDAASPMHNGY